ncbi:hypothetical protein FIV00_14975 [Labrenzia sp. THAF82]|uniref:hypothetical protein n=1 Tax=Labrenzia sp. THAF82 TaxID=2587861 RepID=UPI00126798EF|nr:hypothetical protein [Labrenzia sp. THAF82]QFT31793.1 hypothetical protein FIV00_14975 [Labrenzia sp. THAF82]
MSAQGDDYSTRLAALIYAAGCFAGQDPEETALLLLGAAGIAAETNGVLLSEAFEAMQEAYEASAQTNSDGKDGGHLQ